MELKMNKIRVALVTMSLFTMLIGSSTINLSVNFVNYESGPDAYMYMGYVWEGASWEDAFAAGEVQNKMFGVFPPGTANGTYDVTFTDLAEGNYYAGVFETTYMGYVPDDPALLLVGWYDPAADGNNGQVEPTQITVEADTDVVLETITAPAPPPPSAAAINQPVMFMDYMPQDETTMIMAYVWEGATWAEASAADNVAMAMFAVSTDGMIMGTYDVTFSNLPLGTYYVGVFETTTMMYESAVATVGYYNDTEQFYNNPTTPTAVAVAMDMTYYLETMHTAAMGGDVSVTVDNLSGWNLVGLPAGVEDGSLSAVYPEGTGGTLYAYDGAYVGGDALISGEGYWLHFPDAGTTTITGSPITSLTISLSEGWNLFSGISEVTNVSDIADPGGIIVAGTIYEFTGSYANASVLTPGHGYWVNANADGDITISSGGAAKTRSAFTDQTVKANKLSFNGNDLYFGVFIPEEEMLSYQLPPKPPAGAFDVRFTDDMKVAETAGAIEIMNNTDMLTIAYTINIDAGEHMNWVLTSENGKDHILEGSGEVTVPSAERFVLTRKPVIPITFVLQQNYPNPFNPITTLRYDLPEDNLVTLTVYDMLGREITQLVNTTQKAGYRSVQWDATDSFGKLVSAGVYLYQIQARSGRQAVDPSSGSGHGFVQTKKMVLLK